MVESLSLHELLTKLVSYPISLTLTNLSIFEHLNLLKHKLRVMNVDDTRLVII